MAKRTRSALKRARQDAKRRLGNQKRKKALRQTLRQVQSASGREEALKLLPGAQSVIDRSARHNIISQNAARRLKSRIAREVSGSN